MVPDHGEEGVSSGHRGYDYLERIVTNFECNMACRRCYT